MKLKWSAVRGFTLAACLWASSAAILFSLVGVIAQHPPPTTPPQTWHYTQNYYYGIFAASLYIFIACLLLNYAASICTVHLTLQDRASVEDTSIVLRALTLATFLLGGAAIYVSIEGWSLPDALYWAVYTILTVGIGNIVPKTHLGRSLLFPYATAGITSLGLFVSSIASFSTRMGEFHLRFELQQAGINLHTAPHPHTKYEPPPKINISKARAIKSNYHRRRRWLVFIFSATAWLLLWLVSARIFKSSERSQGWTYFDALYFTFVSLTTIGYGDLYPTSIFGKSFFVFWALLAVPVMTALVGVMGQVGFRAVVYFVQRVWKMWPWGRYKSQIWSFLSKRRVDVPVGVSLLGLDANIEDEKKHPDVYDGSQHDDDLHNPSNSQHGQIKSTRHNLRLGEEIMALVGMLQGDVGNVDLYHEWVRIAPLLDKEYEQGFILSARGHYRPRVSEAICPDRVATDRNKEILLMMRLLIETLCSRMREEVQGGVNMEGEMATVCGWTI
ncbi:hypothetical protein BO94DRAFT_536916 [Aspergillus sclerotioniger CBS 115572]|uniref:Potassium channel domain-containing protein n=1 Tax=Aspergillus sclerotioniger CBS 115572 TaxID=1450535 RepID=A0A317W5Q1_9EURO|nr:hypothetical protein BO94DRAFT_536916 [Aspergillus sclerotioniger CBS 115572]PWY81673.1 hypothetical protein BO94DRAFT_536916 [Aspergillus sclerotioniger CBS 115572]